MGDWPLLSLVTFLPLVGAAFIFFIRGEPEIVARNSRSVALWTALVTFLLSLLIWANFDSSQAGFQLVEKSTWLPGLNIQYYLGVDGISLWFVLLSTLLTLVVVIGSWYSVEVRVKEYMIAFLVMDTLMVGVFCALDIVLFYVFFEGILIPMYLIIGIWGGPRRIYASFKFFLYTLLGSVLFLVAILYLYLVTGTTEIPAMTAEAARGPPALGRAAASVARHVRLLRRQGADVALPHLAARRACRGAHRRLRPAGGRAPQARRLRVPALLPADAARRLGVVRAAGLRTLGHRHRLHLAGGADADRHEEADRLLVGGAHGHRHHRHLHAQRLGRRRQHRADAEPRLRLRCPLHDRRRRLRPHPQPRDRELWRPCRDHAGLRHHLHALHAGLGRPARHLGLRRRDHGHHRRLPAFELGRASSPPPA